MEYSKFIIEINKALPSAELVRKTNGYNSDLEAENFLLGLKLVEIKSDHQFHSEKIDSVLVLLESTNIHEINIGGLNFLPEAEETISGIQEVAYFNDFLFLGESSEGKIFVYDHENEQPETLTPNIDTFLDFLICYNKFDKDFVYRRNNFSQVDLNVQLDKLIKEGFNSSYIKDFFFEF